MASKTCQICGTNSGIYPLCKKHLEMKANGMVIKNQKTGTWELKTGKNIENSKCILCESQTSSNYKFCKECFYNIEARKEELDKNQKPTKLKDYYYNAKDYAMRIFDENKIYYQKLTMSAISSLLENLYNDDAIAERLEKDIEKINENLKEKNQKLDNSIKEKHKIEDIKVEKDKDKAKIKKTQDGHFVESEFEIKVDDLLYTNSFLHAYNVKVDEITERAIYCDWYIPVLLNKGIYIELWGVKGDEKYNKNKKEKIELYKAHRLPLIEIEYDELKDDTQRLRSSIREKINRLKREIIEQIKD